jgi:hypothetical protein
MQKVKITTGLQIAKLNFSGLPFVVRAGCLFINYTLSTL